MDIKQIIWKHRDTTSDGEIRVSGFLRNLKEEWNALKDTMPLLPEGHWESGWDEESAHCCLYFVGQELNDNQKFALQLLITALYGKRLRKSGRIIEGVLNG